MPSTYYCNNNGVPNPFGDYIAFGKFPQNVKSESVNITSGPDINGYYMGDDGEQYVLRKAYRYDSRSIFSNGNTITTNSDYYFKIEPVIWRVLRTENGKATLITQNIMDQIIYQISSNFSNIDGTYILNEGIETYDGLSVSNGTEYANNYKFSNIRTWLNTTFYNFLTTEEKAKVQTTIVDNGKSTTDSNSNAWITEDYTTSDKVFALSFQEFATFFENDSARRFQGTDYAKAGGLWVDNSTYSYFWTRSPASSGSNLARNLRSGGSLGDFTIVNYGCFGICPALVIEL